MSNDTETLTLSDFLLARIAWDEQLARAASTLPEGTERVANLGGHAPASEAPDGWPLEEIGHWGWSGGPVIYADSPEERLLQRIFGQAPDEPGRPYRVSDSGVWDETEETGAAYYRALVPASAGQGTAQHIVFHDPARVLAECAAKRRIVEASSSEAIDAAFYAVPELPADDDWAHGAEWAFGFALRALAQPYSDHPDFREEWRA